MPTDDRPPHPPEEPPPESPEENGRFKVLDVRFWLALAFLVVCIVAAAVVAFFGPKIWPPKPPVHPAPAAASALPPRADADTAALKARIAELEHELDQARQAAAAPGEGPAPGLGPAITARLDRLEDAQKRTTRAAAAAVAAGALADAAETSRPFVGELAALERLTPQNDLLTGLTPLAETGAPTRAALAAGFPEVATRAAAALHAPPKGSSALDRVLAALGRLVTIRRIDDVAGTTPDAALARAERALSDGDLKGALAEVEALPSPARDATAEWRQGARRRLDIEKRIEALRARALRDLAADPGLAA